LSDCNEALRLKPDDAATLTTRGFVHLKLAQHDLAIADFDAALRLEPRQVDSLYLRGLAKLRKGDSEGGSADAAAAKAIRSNVVRQYARYGLVE
jgi:tetratricopeptide (TPR) repeat protein